MSPQEGVTRGGPLPLLPSDATEPRTAWIENVAYDAINRKDNWHSNKYQLLLLCALSERSNKAVPFCEDSGDFWWSRTC